MKTDTPPNAQGQSPALRCDALVSILETAENLAEHQIPFYAYGDNQAACEMSDRLTQIGAELRCAIALAKERAERNANAATSHGRAKP